jgi:hypothetical protein
MLSYHACSKCDARVRRSRIRNVIEFAMSPVILPYRCSICDRREYKFRFIDMNPGVQKDGDEEIQIEVARPKASKAPAVKAETAPTAEESATGQAEQTNTAEKS